MKLIGCVFHILALTFMQADFSAQEKFILKNIQLRSEKCCDAENFGNNRNINKCLKNCELILSICLVKYGDKNRICLIQADATSSITPKTKEMNITFNKSYGVSINVLYLFQKLNFR